MQDKQNRKDAYARKPAKAKYKGLPKSANISHHYHKNRRAVFRHRAENHRELVIILPQGPALKQKCRRAAAASRRKVLANGATPQWLFLAAVLSIAERSGGDSRARPEIASHRRKARGRAAANEMVQNRASINARIHEHTARFMRRLMPGVMRSIIPYSINLRRVPAAW